MIFWNLIKSNNESRWKIREINILERKSKTNPQNQESLNLDQDSRWNHQVNKREIFEIKNYEKLILKLTQITIQN